MDIKALLEELANGTKTAEEVAAEINKGTVPKAVFNDKNNEVKRLEGEITTRDQQLQTLKDSSKDSDSLQAEIDRLQKANEDAKAAYDAEMAQVRLAAAVDTSLLAAKARNPKAVRALLDMDTVKIDGENVLGLAEQLEKLQESDAYLFDIDSQDGGNGNGGGNTSHYSAGGGNRTNPKPNTPDPREAGRKRAMERHNIQTKEEN